MDLEVLANIATILSLPMSIIAIVIGEVANCKVNNYINSNLNNEIKRTKIKDSIVNQNNTRS